MKKVIALLTLVAALVLFSNDALSQNKYTYRNAQYAVRVTTNPSGTEAKMIEYSYQGKWLVAKIGDRVPDNDGINYIVRDGRGVQFSLYYEPSVDKLVMTNLGTEEMAVLDRSKH